MTERQNYSSGSAFEDRFGYSRAVRVGDQLWVAGTTGFDYDTMSISPDPAKQTRQTIRNIERALEEAGSSLADVVQLTTWVAHASDWDAIGAVLGELCGDVRPTNAAIVAGFPFPEVKVEIQAIAVIGCGSKGG